MNSTIIGRNYLVWDEFDKTPDKLNKKRTDKSLQKLSEAFEAIESVIHDSYENNYGLYRILDSCFDRNGIGDLQWKIKSLRDDISGIQKQLAEHKDDVPREDDSILLSDLGFKRDNSWPKYMYFKTIEESDEKDVIEEILIKDEPIRRTRTTIWEKTDYGRSSRSITYRKLRIGKKLMAAINNQKLLNEKMD